jgi:predicted nuclease with TOPRIM domain
VDTTHENRIKELEAQKLALIEKYMKMQDEADEMNERIYHVCCEIEALNLNITKAKEEEAKRKAAQNPPLNGKGNGAAHRPSPDQAAR